MSRSGKIIFQLMLILLIISAIFPMTIMVSSSRLSALQDKFSFTASGDLGMSYASNSSFHLIANSDSEFTLGLGDISYNEKSPETAYCTAVKSIVGPSYPFEIVSGNHEDGGEGNQGLIDNFATCLPDHLNSTGAYGKEYYFDYPITQPLARFIIISPGLNFTHGGFYSYSKDDSHYQWVANAIDGARSKGITWIIVGMHKVCVTMGLHSCEVNPDLLQLLFAKHVDLILEGHDHTYQRSKQLTCIGPLDIHNSDVKPVFEQLCIANSGSDGNYLKGQGSVIVICGIFGGESMYPLTPNDPDSQYFVKAIGGARRNSQVGTVWGSDNSGAGRGFVVYTVSKNSISAQLIFSARETQGTLFTDSFTITNNSQASSPVAAAPLLGQSLLFATIVILPLGSIGILAFLLLYRRQRGKVE